MSAAEEISKTAPDAEHREIDHSSTPPNGYHNDHVDDLVGFEADFSTLPKGYYYSRFFIGSMLATGLGLWAGVAAFGYASPILAQINADIGPDPRYVWISLVYNCCLAVFLAPVGRLSDLFGRRYFFIGGGVIGVIGTIVCATAKSILTMIGGNVLLGIASATQLSFHFVMGELVPLKYRYLGNAGLYVFTIAGSGMGPAISYTMIYHYPNVGWRGVYWLLLAINGAALACWVLFYFPPNFEQKHRHDRASKMYVLKHFDYVGLFLFAAGFVVFLLGLSWGGSLYPWKSAAVISSIVIGVVVLGVFVAWECYAPLKEPLVPIHLFKDGRWVSAIVLLGLGAAVYYAFAIVWPTQAAVLYGNGDPIYTGYLSAIVGMGIIFGQIVGGILAVPIGKTKIQCIVVFLLGGIFLGCMAVSTPDNKNTAIALLILGCFFIGWNESVCLANSTIIVHNQEEIGIAGGMAGSVRAAISAVLVAIYVSILTNRLSTTISSEVPPALIKAGLPTSSVAQFIGAFSIGTPDAFAKVPGITDAIMAVGTRAYKVANADAYRTVYLATIAFSGLAVFLTFFSPNTDELMSNKVAATLHGEGLANERDEKDIHNEV